MFINRKQTIVDGGGGVPVLQKAAISGMNERKMPVCKISPVSFVNRIKSGRVESF